MISQDVESQKANLIQNHRVLLHSLPPFGYSFTADTAVNVHVYMGYNHRLMHYRASWWVAESGYAVACTGETTGMSASEFRLPRGTLKGASLGYEHHHFTYLLVSRSVRTTFYFARVYIMRDKCYTRRA